MFKDGWPDSYSDRELAALHAPLLAWVVQAAASAGSLNNVLQWTSLTEAVSSEMQRRAFARAERDSGWALWVAVAAVVIGAVVGVAQIAVAIYG